ncbi:DUF2889 domain-containing protein [Acidocella sp.]|uniref:DUF2889 domain-containing protein n=1 Tax=Acidocella sp. TaxID=50710 RepID=UPI00261B77E7|nr:DUF2889 domain-containing protein [Acidocella sp.]
MPLPRSAPRQMLHLRDITLRGYEREDGLFDIEGHMTDAKTYSLGTVERPGFAAGEPVHDMWLRLTLAPDMEIRACDTNMDKTPYSYCLGAAPNMQRIVGLRIGKGFMKEALARLGGGEGCTHLRELLQPMATVAFQTMIRGQAKAATQGPAEPDARGRNSCYSYSDHSPVMALVQGAVQGAVQE